MTDRQKQPLIGKLQDNVTRFFEDFHNRHQKNMMCGKGCSKCCVADLSVFSIEAQHIYAWFLQLTPEEKLRIKGSWVKQSTDSAAAAMSSESQKCSFLIDDQCSIYPARPVLCRSQGLPLKVSQSSFDDEESSEEFELSLCDLNFTDQRSLPNSSEWLDLNRLNTLLAIAQQHTDQADIDGGVVRLSQSDSGRISLAELRELLLKI